MEEVRQLNPIMSMMNGKLARMDNRQTNYMDRFRRQNPNLNPPSIEKSLDD